MVKVIYLKDGPHKFHNPSFYALSLMEQRGMNVLSAKAFIMTPSALIIAVSALLTDNEELVNGDPVKVWGEAETGRLIDPTDPRHEQMYTSVCELIAEAIGAEAVDVSDAVNPPTATLGDEKQ